MDTDREDLLEAFQQATADFKICPNRMWAVAGESLPKFLPEFKPNPFKHKHSPYNDEDDHQSCTFDFCEFSQRDFTAVQQRHECGGANCMQLRDWFPRDILNNAASSGGSTVWKLSGHTMLDSPRSYMAISHVWSDGTGAGAWQDGIVNECLYAYFRGIAEQFSCDGIWWDTICIPREKAARNRAIQNIQNNYQDAKITLVHDCFLRNWRWDSETACFAILMSPWFSRGWTALELAKSRKVKVIFRGRSGPIIKDLDEEILAKEDDPDSPRKEASRIIQNLRKDITSLNGLLTVLGPRHTSWPKDLAIISALLVGVTPEEKQQTTYRNILRKIGRLSHGHLFHNSATMSEEFGWCPTSIFKIPLSFSSETEPCLTIHDDGVHGRWRLKQADQMTEEICSWAGSHPLIRKMLESALKKPQQCWLLAKCGTESVKEALLVKKTQAIHYEYIGALFFRQGLQVPPDDTGHWIETDVVISNLSPANEKDLDSESSGSLGHLHLADENVQQNDDLGDTSEVNIFRRAIWRGDQVTVAKLSGKSELYVPDSLGWSPLHLAAERGDESMVHLLLQNSDVNLRSKDGRTALHRAAWSGSVSVVKLLLDHHSDPLAADNDGNFAFHAAAQMGFKPIVWLLRKHTSLDATGCNGLTALHYAIINRHTAMALLLLEDHVRATVIELKLGWTPLHCAAGVGDEEIAEKLITKGAQVNVKDCRTGWTPLHLAAINRHNGVMRLFIDNDGDLEMEDNYGWTPERFSRVNAHMGTVHPRLGGSENPDLLKNNIRWTMLHCMAVNGPDELFKFLVKKVGGTDFYGQDENWSPLLFAVENGLRTPIEWLVHEGHDLEQRDSSGLTALSLAVKEGHTLIVELLLRTGANIDARDQEYCTPISWAARCGNIGAVEMLLDKGARIMEWKKDRLPPLVWAAKMGHVAVVEILLARGANIEGWSDRNTDSNDDSDGFPRNEENRRPKKPGQREESSDDVESENASESEGDYDYGLSPLSWAARMGHEAVIELLLRRGADIDGRDIREDDKDVLAPLECAARMGHLRIVQLLLSRGASVEGSNCDEGVPHMTPLGWAARMGNLRVVDVLLSQGASTEKECCRRKEEEKVGFMAPLSWAVEMGHQAVADLLLKMGASVDESFDNDAGGTLLSWAAKMGHTAVVELLLQKGANIEGETDPDGEAGPTPLGLAAQMGHTSIVEVLLQNGANFEGTTDFHSGSRKFPKPPVPYFTPFSSAAFKGHTAIVDALLRSGERIEAYEDKRDMRPLALAARNGHIKIVQLLLRHKESGTQLRRAERKRIAQGDSSSSMELPSDLESLEYISSDLEFLEYLPSDQELLEYLSDYGSGH